MEREFTRMGEVRQKISNVNYMNWVGDHMLSDLTSDFEEDCIVGIYTAIGNREVYYYIRTDTNEIIHIEGEID